MIRFECHECGKALQCGEDRAGTKVACPQCKTHLTVPSVQAEPVVEAAEPPAPLETGRRRRVSREETMFFDDNVDVDLPVELPPDADQLGTPLFVCQPKSETLMFPLGIGIGGLILAGVCGSRLPSTKIGFAWVVLLALTIVGIGLMGVVLYGLKDILAEMRTKLIGFSDGLILLDGNRDEVCRWEDVDGLFRFVEHTQFFAYGFEVGNKITQAYEVRRKDGQRFGAGPGHSNVELFGALVQTKVPPILYPVLKQRFEAGETLDCGEFQINQRQICRGDDCLDWSELLRVRLDNGTLTIERAGKRGEPWAEVLGVQVANLEVFYELAQKYADQPDSMEPGGGSGPTTEENPFDFGS